MTDTFIVRIDLKQVQENLAQARDYVEEPEIRAWLAEEGFRDQGDGWWVCEEVTLDLLDRSEVLEARPI